MTGKTPDSCDQACTSESTMTCDAFSVGVSGGNDAGACWLFSSTCSSEGNTNQDVYIASAKIYPSTTKSVCTHLQEWSANKDKIDECKAITTQPICNSNPACVFNEIPSNVLDTCTHHEPHIGKKVIQNTCRAFTS